MNDDPNLTIHTDLIQGTGEWLQARCGILTASVVGKLLTAGRKVANNDTSRAVTRTLAAERITGYAEPTPMSGDMWRGVEHEPFARDMYAEHHAPVTEVGLMIRDLGDGLRIGYSPDGLVGDNGGIEIKARKPHIQFGTFLTGEAPEVNLAQVQTGLLVSGRDWVDYCSFTPGMPMFVQRITPDPAWFEVIVAAARQFEANVADLTAKYRAATKGLPIANRIPDTTGEMTF